MEQKKIKKVETEIKPIPLRAVRRMCEKFKDMDDSTPLTFEFILTAFFPSVYRNIMDEINKQYTKGYVQGREDTLNESKTNS